MMEIDNVPFPELFGTYVSEEDEILLDLWDQGLDNNITSFQDRSQDPDSRCDSEEYSYIYGDHSHEESSDSDTDNDNEESDSDSDDSSESDSSDSNSNSDSDDDSSSSDSDDDLIPHQKLKIRPMQRTGRLARPMRVQLLRRHTFIQAFGRDQWCCSDRCITHWRFVKKHEVYRDYT